MIFNTFEYYDTSYKQCNADFETRDICSFVLWYRCFLQALYLLNLDIRVKELFKLVLVLGAVEHFIFHQAFYEQSYYSCHFASLLVLFRHVRNFLYVFQSIHLNVFRWQSDAFWQSCNNINRVQTDGILKNTLQVFWCKRVVHHLDQKAYSHKWIVFYQQIEVLTADVQV